MFGLCRNVTVHKYVIRQIVICCGLGYELNMFPATFMTQFIRTRSSSLLWIIYENTDCIEDME